MYNLPSLEDIYYVKVGRLLRYPGHEHDVHEIQVFLDFGSIQVLCHSVGAVLGAVYLV